jgi:cysteine synthase A
MRESGEGIWLRQFENPMNAYAHEITTGPEIYSDLKGNVDIYVSGVGSGGTISGVGRYLKAKNPSLKLVAVEPKESAVLSGGVAGSHRIQGIGAGFLPTILDKNAINRVITVGYEEADECAKMLALKEGILSGISSGAALFAAIILGREKENENKNIALVLPDGAEKYFAT